MDTTGVSISTGAGADTPPEEKKPFRKIAIVGTAESLPQAPYDDKSFEIWSISCARTYPAFKRWDRLFEMHDEAYWGAPEILDRLNTANCPIYMQEVYEKVPKSVKYPLAEVSEGYHRNFTNSIVYMIALAVLEKVGHIALFGVHMAADEEYAYQLPSCEYWLGVAEANGISIHVQPPSALLRCQYLYGYDREWKMKRDLSQRMDALRQGKTQLETALEQAKKNLWMQEGAMKDCEYLERMIG